MTRLLLGAAALAAGCGWFEPALDPLTAAPLIVATETAWTVSTDATLPTDLAVAGEEILVLDGYQGRLLRHDRERSASTAVTLPDLHRPSRLALTASGEALWLSSPGSPTLVRVGLDGQLLDSVDVQHADGSAVLGVAAVLDRGGDLVVALSEGALATVAADTGLVSRVQREDVDGVELGTAVHLSADGDELLLTDTFGPQVHRFDAALAPVHCLGHRGLWIGALGKPKASLAGPEGTVVVADSALGSVQLFDADGQALGALAIEGEPVRFEHPIALAWTGPGELAVLDAITATVHGLRLSSEAIDTARTEAEAWRHLRTELVDIPHAQQLASGSLCWQCHDGTVLDHRENWDEGLHHHPVHEPSPEAVPAFFPVDEEGRLRCTTCHSPHGTVAVADVEAVERGEPYVALVRHAPSEGDQFTRLSRDDNQLCVACHTEAAHDQALASMTEPGTAHPTGAALHRALEAREGASAAGLPGDLGHSCLTCHDVHGAEREGLLRASATTEVCIACHLDQARPERSHALHGEGLDEGCASCHDLVGGTSAALLAPGTQGGLCTGCHARIGGAHGKVRGAHGSGCLGCHDIHDAPVGEGLLARAGTAADPSGCLSCHAPGRSAGKAATHAGTLGHPVSGELACGACHDAHRPATTPACGSCHADQEAAADRGGHGTATCADCHPAHGAPPAAPELGVNPRSATCLACHAPGGTAATPIPAWDHPAPVFAPDGARWTPLGILTLFDPQGEPVSASAGGALTCSTCHPTHGPEPGAAELVRAELETACAACHGEQAPKLLRDFHRLSARRR